ncbi:Ger(x)C family spore germination protein [Paenibacillus sp. HB172176]|uniref:Ger(x)C family spore germination protein n=1 Tax=Paenibacillus sp. HB172176 TaxID=2493690 RepID=UPI00143B8385|nr:Ger(x)C family spore germination protein [Paenibacillus sp. HB172176]
MLYKLTIIFLCLALTTGCWSRRELNELLIVLGIAIDWEDGQYLISFQVVNPGEISQQRSNSNGRPPGTLYQGRGKTVLEAARSLTAEAPRKVYMGHLQLYVISEEVARRGILEVVDSALRDNETRMDFNLIVARGMKANSILKLYTPMEKLPTYNMLESLQTSQKNWAPTIAVTMDEAMNKLSVYGDQLALTGIHLVGNDKLAESKHNVETFLPASRFRYTGIAAFKGEKLIGWLNEKESRGYTDVTNHLSSTSIELPCDEKHYLGVEITSSDSKLKTSIDEQGMPKVEVQISSEANIVNNPCQSVDLSDPATIKRLEKESIDQINSNAQAVVKKAQEIKSDFLGFGSEFGKQHPAYWKTVEENWNTESFLLCKVSYKIELHIRRTGLMGNSTLKKTS